MLSLTGQTLSAQTIGCYVPFNFNPSGFLGHSERHTTKQKLKAMAIKLLLFRGSTLHEVYRTCPCIRASGLHTSCKHSLINLNTFTNVNINKKFN